MTPREVDRNVVQARRALIDELLDDLDRAVRLSIRCCLSPDIAEDPPNSD